MCSSDLENNIVNHIYDAYNNYNWIYGMDKIINILNNPNENEKNISLQLFEAEINLETQKFLFSNFDEKFNLLIIKMNIYIQFTNVEKFEFHPFDDDYLKIILGNIIEKTTKILISDNNIKNINQI